MGWWSDWARPFIVGSHIGGAQGALLGTAAGPGFGTLIGAVIGSVTGGVTGVMQEHQTQKEEEAQYAQLAAAQKIADAQNPANVVQSVAPAEINTVQAQVNDINNSTSKARKFALSKSAYQGGLSSFGSTFGMSGSNRKQTLG